MLLDINNMQEPEYVVAAMHYRGVAEAEATAEWRSCHYKNRFVICESRKGYECGRMFIRVMTDSFLDALKKAGWWNVFTLSKYPVSYGLWLCKVQTYRVDHNGYLNMVVDPMVEFPKMKWENLANRHSEIWESKAINFMFGGERRFLPGYEFKQYGRANNVSELKKRYPKYGTKSRNELRDAVLFDWLRGDITIDEIEDALNEFTDYEKFIRRVQTAVANGTVKEEFPEYPLFAEKIVRSENSTSRLLGKGFIGFNEVKDYIDRNVMSYNDLVKEQKLVPVESDDPLDKIEAVLIYRKNLKALEKEAKKAARKKKSAK